MHQSDPAVSYNNTINEPGPSVFELDQAFYGTAAQPCEEIHIK